MADDGLINGRRYTYTLTAVDPAGNVVSATASAVPTGPLLAPIRGAADGPRCCAGGR